MSEWVSESEISSRLGHKILIAGLSEAGKTAVKRIFFLKQRTEDVDKLSATINYERLSVTIKNTPITIVDLGGQKIFLKKFLSAFSPFVFSNVKIFIFLIDTANKTTRNNAFQYFKASIEKLYNYSPSAEVFVFLHKNDLVRSSPNYESIHTQLKESFQLEYSEPLRFFRTSIYKPETVIDSFGRIFELSIPEIAQSDFVDERTIGELEEYHGKGMTLRKVKAKVKTSSQSKIQITAPKMAGDPAVLQQLQSLMQQATEGSEAEITTPPSSTPISITKPVPVQAETTPTVKPVQPSAERPSPPSEMPPSPTISQEISPFPTELPDSSEPERPLVTTPEVSELETPSEAEEVVNQIVYLVEFCGIAPDEATEVVKSGYGELFKIAASSGIPVPLLSDVFLKYIPFVRTSEGEKKFSKLTGQRLLDIFSAHLKNKLDEEMIIKCLVFAVNRPKMAIDEIVNKYLAPEIKKKEKEKVKKKPTVVPMEIPLQTEAVDSTITLPGTRGISFNVELIEDTSNAQVSLFLQDHTGKKGLIGSSQVSTGINQNEILYLLAYEMNLANVGYFEDGVSSMAFSARVIYEAIKKLKEQPLISPKVVVEKGSLLDSIDYLIPLEIKTNGEFVILPDTEKLGFSVEQSHKRGVLINFVQRGYPIGKVNVIETVNHAQLSGLLSQALQLPIESTGAVDFAARMINIIIKTLVKSKDTKFPRKVELVEKEVKEEDETSQKLMQYLSLLESD
ncbi:hypothetical protein CEE45_10660 [Candidatus Heimdallarchaeota archaeon B3_Heim]|nr:MAG: hypothetical protein CEE45_10660 [Candidatus Heimdallarchaeota archaeon B3_Heim]